jgi:hypothetical protein
VFPFYSSVFFGFLFFLLFSVTFHIFVCDFTFILGFAFLFFPFIFILFLSILVFSFVWISSILFSCALLCFVIFFILFSLFSYYRCLLFCFLSLRFFFFKRVFCATFHCSFGSFETHTPPPTPPSVPALLPLTTTCTTLAEPVCIFARVCVCVTCVSCYVEMRVTCVCVCYW